MAELDAPGAGLPGFETFYLNVFLKIASAIRSDASITANFQASSQKILQIVDGNDVGLLSQEILIPRIQGIEDSSRHWSVLMVIEHLAKVNREIMDTIRSLRSGNVPFDEARIADYKPDRDTDLGAVDRFRDVNQRYWSFATSHQPLRSQLTSKHPWFGHLDGHSWHCLAAEHQKIHLRQIYKMLAMIGVV